MATERLAEAREQNESPSTAGAALEKTKDVAGEAQRSASDWMQDMVDERSTQVGGELQSAARALRGSSERLRSEGDSEKAAGAAEFVAERVERLGSYLEREDAASMMRAMEDMARRRPWLVAGAAAAVGLAASRFLKASSTRRYQDSGTYELQGNPSWTR
jgi:ElaB/YqjD/DUF883 family membrane-anchored ribosome-binding protein